MAEEDKSPDQAASIKQAEIDKKNREDNLAYTKQQSEIEVKHNAALVERAKFLTREITSSDNAATGVGIGINWQIGSRGQDTEANPHARLTPNGAAPEDLAKILLNRLEYLDSKLPSEFNKKAIDGIKLTISALSLRKADRVKRGELGSTNL